MADEPKNGGENGDDAERPRRSKPSSGTFDPVEFGQQILGTGEGGDDPPARAPRPTLTDEAELEEARRRSMAEAGPKGALSLANFHAPSVPPAPASSTPLFQAELTEFDLGWDEESPTVPRNVDAPDAGATAASQQKITAPPPGGDEASFADLNEDGHDEPAPPTRPAEVPPELVEESQRSEPRPAERDAPPSKTEGPPSAVEMADRVALGDFSGALEIAEQLLELDPGHAEAQKVAEEARETLLAMYTARIGDLEAVPVVAVAREELRWLSIDHRAGFVLSLVDGVSTVEMVLDVSGMPRFDALRLLHELLQKRIISIR